MKPLRWPEQDLCFRQHTANITPSSTSRTETLLDGAIPPLPHNFTRGGAWLSTGTTLSYMKSATDERVHVQLSLLLKRRLSRTWTLTSCFAEICNAVQTGAYCLLLRGVWSVWRRRRIRGMLFQQRATQAAFRLPRPPFVCISRQSFWTTGLNTRTILSSGIQRHVVRWKTAGDLLPTLQHLRWRLHFPAKLQLNISGQHCILYIILLLLLLLFDCKWGFTRWLW
jgi:hypothetical protein